MPKRVFLNSFFLNIFILLFLCLVIVSIYSITLEGSFVLDDMSSVTDNTYIRLTDLTFDGLHDAAFESPAGNRPLPNISFALNYYFHKYDVVGYHIVNILIHIMTGLFLFFLIKATVELSYNVNRKSDIGYRNDQDETQILGIPYPVLIAFCATLLWIVHPLHTQSVTYIVQRMTSMAAMFYVLSFLFYVKGRVALKNNRAVFQGEKRVIASEATQSHGLYGSSVMRLLRAFALAMTPIIPWIFFSVSILSGLCALGSKQITVTLPFFIFLYEWYFFQDLRTDWIKKRIYIILGGIVFLGIMALLYIGTNPFDWLLSAYERRDFTLSQRVMTEFRVVILYINLLIFPHPSRLTLDYDFPLSYSLINPITTILSLFVIIALFVLAIYTARRHRLLSFSILWFLGNLVIESSVIPLELVYEHRTYLPSMFIGLLVVLLFLRYVKYKWVNLALLLIAVSLFSFWTYERNEVWSDELTFLEDAVAKAPNKARVHNNLGLAMFHRKQMDSAIYHYREALKADPDYIESLNNLGNALAEMGKAEEAIGCYDAVLEKYPHYFRTYNNLGNIFANRESYDKAIFYYEEALKINPMYMEANYNVGNAYANLGRYGEAEDYYRRALSIDPDYEKAHFNLGNALAKQGMINEAIGHYREALRIRGDYPQAKKNLAVVLERKERVEAAIEDVNKLIELNPSDPDLRNRLGSLYRSIGKHDRAIERYSEALLIKPDYIPALNNLAIVYSMRGEDGKSLEYLMRIMNVDLGNADVSYNIACIYAKRNEKEASTEWLRKAIERGFSNRELINTDKDLENIRDTEYYEKLVGEL